MLCEQQRTSVFCPSRTSSSFISSCSRYNLNFSHSPRCSVLLFSIFFAFFSNRTPRDQGNRRRHQSWPQRKTWSVSTGCSAPWVASLFAERASRWCLLGSLDTNCLWSLLVLIHRVLGRYHTYEYRTRTVELSYVLTFLVGVLSSRFFVVPLVVNAWRYPGGGDTL